MNIDIGNIARLSQTYQLREGNNWVHIDYRAPLKVKSKGYLDDKEYCEVTGNGFSIGIECDKLIKIKEKGKINIRLLQVLQE